jgi:uncharacterized cupredoxin-like copper-binding protein
MNLGLEIGGSAALLDVVPEIARRASELSVQEVLIRTRLVRLRRDAGRVTLLVKEFQLRLHRLAFIPSAVLLVAACSSGGATPAAPSAATPPTSAAPSIGASSAPSAAATRIVVTLTDALKIEPASMTVPAGVPVTFVITNSGATDHEFYLGDEKAQAAHEKEMVEMGGMTHDEPEGIAVKPGETKELTYTFAEAGHTLAGCHVVGHYGGGMKAEVNVEG